MNTIDRLKNAESDLRCFDVWGATLDAFRDAGLESLATKIEALKALESELEEAQERLEEVEQERDNFQSELEELQQDLADNYTSNSDVEDYYVHINEVYEYVLDGGDYVEAREVSNALDDVVRAWNDFVGAKGDFEDTVRLRGDVLIASPEAYSELARQFHRHVGDYE